MEEALLRYCGISQPPVLHPSVLPVPLFFVLLLLVVMLIAKREQYRGTLDFHIESNQFAGRPTKEAFIVTGCGGKVREIRRRQEVLCKWVIWSTPLFGLLNAIWMEDVKVRCHVCTLVLLMCPNIILKVL